MGFYILYIFAAWCGALKFDKSRSLTVSKIWQLFAAPAAFKIWQLSQLAAAAGFTAALKFDKTSRHAAGGQNLTTSRIEQMFALILYHFNSLK